MVTLKKKEGSYAHPSNYPMLLGEMLVGVQEIFNLHGTTGRKNKLENS